MNRIDKKFKELKNNKKSAFVAFITAGYPDLGVTEKLISEFTKIGVDILELGVPFSDPLADGPIIQEASKSALEKKVNLSGILEIVKKARKSSNMPICLMTYYNPVFCFGEEKFVQEAVKAGVDGIIIPDLPPEEAGNLIKASRRYNLATIFFLAPTSSEKRIKLVSKASTGFIYYVSLTGVTGPRKSLPKDLIDKVKTFKKITDKPICVGFGVSSLEQVKEIQKVADGVIVGSAIVGKIKENIGNPDILNKVADFVRHLKGKD